MMMNNEFSNSNLPVNIRKSTIQSLRPSTKRLYSIIEDQLSIYCDDWYRFYDGHDNDSDFWMGIYELQLCGLIQESMARTKSSSSTSRRIVYEKVSVVWC